MPTDPRLRRTARAATVRKKRTYTAGLAAPQLRKRPRVALHTVIGVVLLLLAATLIPTHLAEHAGAIRLMPQNLEDVLIGFPTAAVLGIAGFVALIWR